MENKEEKKLKFVEMRGRAIVLIGLQKSQMLANPH